MECPFNPCNNICPFERFDVVFCIHKSLLHRLAEAAKRFFKRRQNGDTQFAPLHRLESPENTLGQINPSLQQIRRIADRCGQHGYRGRDDGWNQFRRALGETVQQRRYRLCANLRHVRRIVRHNVRQRRKQVHSRFGRLRNNFSKPRFERGSQLGNTPGNILDGRLNRFIKYLELPCPDLGILFKRFAHIVARIHRGSPKKQERSRHNAQRTDQGCNRRGNLPRQHQRFTSVHQHRANRRRQNAHLEDDLLHRPIQRVELVHESCHALNGLSDCLLIQCEQRYIRALNSGLKQRPVALGIGKHCRRHSTCCALAVVNGSRQFIKILVACTHDCQQAGHSLLPRQCRGIQRLFLFSQAGEFPAHFGHELTQRFHFARRCRHAQAKFLHRRLDFLGWLGKPRQ